MILSNSEKTYPMNFSEVAKLLLNIASFQAAEDLLKKFENCTHENQIADNYWTEISFA